MRASLIGRRALLGRVGMGLGSLAFAELAGLHAGRVDGRGAPAGRVHHQPRAMAVIHLFMNGGPAQMDTFDPKPELAAQAGKALDKDRPQNLAMPSPFAFRKCGQSGLEVSEVFPRVGEQADRLCVIRSMKTDIPDHEQSLRMMTTGNSTLPRPSLGSWLLYGLGEENRNLPGFLAMCPNGYPLEADYWQSAFLPAMYQGTYVDTQHLRVDQLIEHVRSAHATRAEQRQQLDLLAALNRQHQQSRADDQRLEARLRSFELAFQMQREAVEAFDINQESKSVRALYGDGLQGRQMLIARRLVERGVRYVQVWYGEGVPWDHHDGLADNLRAAAQETDQAISGLLADLAQRGMLQNTLVIWGGEFGRLPVADQEGTDHATHGRGHNAEAFTVWLAGGGVKPGMVYGASDEFGWKVAENPVHVHDLQATILHLMGFDHEKLVYRYAGRDFRLTETKGRVVREILA